MSKQSSVSPIDDLTFDVLSVLHQKAKALAAYDTYLADADAEDDDEVRDLFVEMRKQDEEHVQVLKDVLARRLEEDLAYDEDTDGEDDVDDDMDVVEDYDDADEEEVEDPSTVSTATRGDDALATPGAPSPPRRGESTQRHR
ncbi:MAG: hypothetical protein NVS3B10_26560 [Polyangiales bacterium]